MPQLYNQRAVNLLIATAPISLAVLLDPKQEPPNLAYRPDARTKFDILFDAYPIFHEPIITTGSGSKTKVTRYYNPIHADIIDYLKHEKNTITSLVVEQLFGLSRHNAAEHLYELAVLGSVRALRYRTVGSDNLYTLPDARLTIVDIPDGERNDRILALYAKGYNYTVIAQKFGVSSDVIRRLCQRWPEQRAMLLAPPTN